MSANTGSSNIKLWEPTCNTLYDTYFQELSCEALMKFWEMFAFIAGFLTGITASGSAVAGWALWYKPGFKLCWAAMAGTAAVISIIHNLCQVPRRLKEQEKLRMEFCQLRIDLETFSYTLSMDTDEKTAKKFFEDLRKRFSDSMGNAHPDIAFTKKMRYTVKAKLNKLAKEKGFIQ